MRVPFSSPIDGRHYHRPDVIKPTCTDHVPPAIDWLTTELLHGNEVSPDAMVITFIDDRPRK